MIFVDYSKEALNTMSKQQLIEYIDLLIQENETAEARVKYYQAKTRVLFEMWRKSGHEQHKSNINNS